jgi:hypothetical protein
LPKRNLDLLRRLGGYGRGLVKHENVDFDRFVPALLPRRI